MVITRVSINNPVFATMMMVALFVLGLFSLQRLKVEQNPEVAFPFVSVITRYPGASAEAVEQDVTRRVEEAVSTVRGIKSIRSNSREGFSWVGAEFELDVNASQATQDVRDKVAEAKLAFNKDVGEPSVQREQIDGNSEPVLFLSLRSDARSLRELSDIAEQIVVKRLQGVKGVATVEISGSRARELAVSLKPGAMAAFGVTVEQVLEALRRENQDVPAGALVSQTSERSVRIAGKLRAPADFERIIVTRRNNLPVTLGQIAEVRDGEREMTSIATHNGKRQLSLEIQKTREANAIELSQAVRKQLLELRKSLPADVTIEPTFDTSVFIRDSINNVKETILEGALLTIAIVFLFLHSWRSTVITGLALPVSVFATFIALYFFGFTLNFLTLMALSLSIGVLIDDAIVVRENIVRHLRMGKSHRQAALEATQEIGLAVLATTLSIVAVFVPVAFMGGIIGKFFYQFGITVTVAVLTSLFVSFTLDPMLSAVWRDRPSRWMERGPVAWLLGQEERFMSWLHRVYDGALAWALRHRKTTLAMAAGTLMLAFLIPILGLVGSEFTPQTDDGWANVRIETPAGSSLEYTIRKAEQVEAAIREMPEVRNVYATVNKLRAFYWIDIGPKSGRKRGKKEIDDAMRARMKQIPGIETRVGWNKPVQVDLLGADIGELQRISNQVIAELKKIPGAVDIETSLKPTNPTLEVTINRELASDLGISMSQVALTTRAMIAGEPAGQWQGPDGENHQITVRLPDAERRAIADLDRLQLVASGLNADGSPRMVPLRQIATFTPAFGERTIERRDLQRVVRVSANVSKDAKAGEVTAALDKVLKQMSFPPGYRFKYGGDSEIMQDSFGHAMAALGLAIVFIYFILASQFGSFLQPVAIMASLPLSLVGVFLALAVWRSSLNVFSMIGLIMLMGLVTKNAILLVDFINRSRKEGYSQTDAILRAASVRLRPIIMTTGAMVFGMLPLALALGPGSEQQSPMAHAVIGGILTSTVLTLVVVPVLYTYFAAIGDWATRKLASERVGDEPGPSAATASGAPSGAPAAAD
jgi:HAE1 family hydrophobic/amphiphilic exporter-1